MFSVSSTHWSCTYKLEVQLVLEVDRIPVTCMIGDLGPAPVSVLPQKVCCLPWTSVALVSLNDGLSYSM